MIYIINTLIVYADNTNARIVKSVVIGAPEILQWWWWRY